MSTDRTSDGGVPRHAEGAAYAATAAAAAVAAVEAAAKQDEAVADGGEVNKRHRQRQRHNANRAKGGKRALPHAAEGAVAADDAAGALTYRQAKRQKEKANRAKGPRPAKPRDASTAEAGSSSSSSSSMAAAVAGETFRRLEAPSQEILADECMVLSELSVPASEHSTPERDSTAMMSVEEEAETAVEQEDVAEEVDAVPALACPRPESTCLHAPAGSRIQPSRAAQPTRVLMISFSLSAAARSQCIGTSGGKSLSLSLSLSLVDEKKAYLKRATCVDSRGSATGSSAVQATGEPVNSKPPPLAHRDVQRAACRSRALRRHEQGCPTAVTSRRLIYSFAVSSPPSPRPVGARARARNPARRSR